MRDAQTYEESRAMTPGCFAFGKTRHAPGRLARRAGPRKVGAFLIDRCRAFRIEGRAREDPREGPVESCGRGGASGGSPVPGVWPAGEVERKEAVSHGL